MGKITPRVTMKCASCLNEMMEGLTAEGTRIGSEPKMRVTTLKARPGRRGGRVNTLY